MLFPTKQNLCAVITSFNPDPEFADRILQISKQVSGVVIIDNNSIPEIIYWLEALSVKSTFHAIFNSSNLGVATALNQGIRWAKVNNYNWVILFDQDTVISDNMVEILFSTYQRIGKWEQIGIIGADYFNIGTEDNNDQASTDTCYQEVKSMITSGSLFSIDLFDKIGPFRDDLFIDFIDIEYCLRARFKGFKIIKLKAQLMQQSIGSTTMHKLPWRSTGTSNHSPIRRYYMMRNNIILAKEYFSIDLRWVFSSLFITFKSIPLICFYEKDKLIKLRYTFLGILDGITGKLDRLK